MSSSTRHCQALSATKSTSLVKESGKSGFQFAHSSTTSAGSARAGIMGHGLLARRQILLQQLRQENGLWRRGGRLAV
eukprot:CAMPEP_0183535618 /NCGR_PEP_ID=MMETSP0371-20130417/27683_1 /TAXON_ID=268820 /ORGANISM="Peridinium aciculiferum, Strain PAER-2" /LENGTH=76 /DNA_ID=CAMNT_0025736103 /DNA_START=109 /DNA_END=336 /DNA_ORIENTATION=+